MSPLRASMSIRADLYPAKSFDRVLVDEHYSVSNGHICLLGSTNLRHIKLLIATPQINRKSLISHRCRLRLRLVPEVLTRYRVMVLSPSVG